MRCGDLRSVIEARHHGQGLVRRVARRLRVIAPAVCTSRGLRAPRSNVTRDSAEEPLPSRDFRLFALRLHPNLEQSCAAASA